MRRTRQSPVRLTQEQSTLGHRDDLGGITGGKEPGVSIDEAGRVWVTTITPAGGIALSSF